MLLYCKDGVVIASHSDTQSVPSASYGDGVQVIPVADDFVLTRAGDPPAPGMPDARPFAAPTPSPDMLKAYAAQVRWQKETGGISVSGQYIATDRESQAMITGALAFVQQNPAATINWKSEGGFIALSAAQINAIGVAVATHVQACFTAEAAAEAAVTAGATTSFAQIDAAFSQL